MSQSKFRVSLRDAALLLFVLLITIYLGTLLPQSSLTLISALLLIFICVISAFVGALVAGGIVSEKFTDSMSINGTFKSDADRLKSIQGEIFISNENLQQIEAKIDVPLVWIVTSDLAFDSSLASTSFKAIMIENCHMRNVTYTYIVPETVREPSEQALLSGFPRGKVRVMRVSMLKWPQLPHSDGAVIIYNPYSKEGHAPCFAYFEYPTKDGLVWLKVETRKAVEWADRITELISPEALS